MASLYAVSKRPLSLYKDRRKGSRMSTEERDKILADTTTLYVGNLSFYTTEEQIFDLFSKVGEIKRIIMGLDRIKKTPCGFCFVEYFKREDAVKSVQFLSDTKLDERTIRVDYDFGFEEGRQYGRGRSGGQVRDEHRIDYDPGRGGYGKAGPMTANDMWGNIGAGAAPPPQNTQGNGNSRNPPPFQGQGQGQGGQYGMYQNNGFRRGQGQGQGQGQGPPPRSFHQHQQAPPPPHMGQGQYMQQQHRYYQNGPPHHPHHHQQYQPPQHHGMPHPPLHHHHQQHPHHPHQHQHQHHQHHPQQQQHPHHPPNADRERDHHQQPPLGSKRMRPPSEDHHQQQQQQQQHVGPDAMQPTPKRPRNDPPIDTGAN